MEKKLKGMEGTLLFGCFQNIRPFNFPSKPFNSKM